MHTIKMRIKTKSLIKLLLSLSLSLSFCVWVLVGLNGCATTSSQNSNQPTMAQIYQQAMNDSQGANLNRVRSQVNRLPGVYNTPNTVKRYSLNQRNDTKNLFHRLPNPQVNMYVYPHLAGNQDSPVPGYTTGFPMFEKVHYALPGEMGIVK